jgi:DNA-binding NarL/FixJ family response regulator
MSIRMMVVDDHEVVRTGIASLLADSDVEVIGEASGGDAAVEMAHQLNPEVILMDIRMPEGDGLTALDRIRSEMPEIRIVMLSTYDNPTYMARARALGASDYVLKGADRETFLNTIRAAAEDKAPSVHGVMRPVAQKMATRAIDVEGDASLTQRETQVLRHLALGLSNREIGKSLSISIETVKEHVQNILRKIDATDRTQAAVWAVRRKMV